MVIYFKVANFHSIKEPVVLNFQAASLSEHERNVLKVGNTKLVKSLLLYGHNASGKSNVLDAFVLFRQMIRNSTENKVDEKFPINPFRFHETTENAPCLFECMFELEGTRYRYGFEANKDQVVKEWLLESKAAKEYPLFLRIEDKFQINKKRFPNAEGLQVRTRKNVLFISVAGQWAVAKAEKIINWFASCITLHGMMDDSFKEMTVAMLSNKKYNKILKEFISKADLGIIDARLIKIPKEKDKNKEKSDEKEEPSYDVVMMHTKYDKNNQPLEKLVPMSLEYAESEGTRKYFNMIGPIIYALYNNRFMVVDEYDARLHSLLSMAILKLFNSGRIKSTAQLLIATHDTSLLDKELMRRDQIVFAEKDNYGATKLTTLSTYKPRKEAPYDKNYLEGKYGGIPVIDELDKILADGKA